MDPVQAALMEGCRNNNNNNEADNNCERSLFAHRDTTIYISFRVAPEFQGAYHVLFSLALSLVFFYFSKWILLLLVQVKHKRMLYRFLLSKLEICNGNNEDRRRKTITEYQQKWQNIHK